MKKQIILPIGLLMFLTAGAVETPPCTITINSQEAFDQWTVIDANNDGTPYRFEYSATDPCALYSQNTSGAANDWLISPPVTLEAGSAYNVTFFVQNLSSYVGDKQAFDIMVGTEPTAEMSTKLFSETSLAKTSYQVERSGKYSPDQSGEYYFALHLTSKSYQGNFAVYSLKVEEIAVHPGAVTNLTVEAGEKGALQALLSWTWPTVNDQGGSQFTIIGADIYRGTSSYFTANDNSKVGTMQADDIQPGTQANWTDNTITSSGKYYYKVVPFNAAGSSSVSPTSVQSPYIGKATSISTVKNLVAAVVTDNDKQISLTWDAPTASEGWFDPAEVSYKITRSQDGATAVTIEESWQGEQPYIDTVDGLASYQYTVYTIFNGTTAWSGQKSNSVVTGGTLSLPYTNAFASSSDIALWTLFHGESYTRDWGISSGKLDFWGGSTADAWAVTPKFSLQAGKAYQISFATNVSRAASPKNLAVAVGTEPAADALSEEIFSEKIASTYAETKTLIFSVPADGDYCIGFHCFGDTDNNDLYVDDLKIEEIAESPLGVENARAEAAAEGALKVTLSWTNPSKSNAGTTLAAIDKVVISSNDTELKTIENPAPGAEMSETFTVETAGIHTFAISVYLNENVSETVEAVSEWVGYDTPKAPETVTLTRGDDGERIISFSAVTEGVHGGYINLENICYEIKRNDDVLISNQHDSPYIDGEEISELAVYTYGVAAVNGELTGEYTLSAPITLGNALALPYQPDFDNPEDFKLWTLNDWKLSKAYPLGSTNTLNTDKTSWAYTPPIEMKAGKCELKIEACCYNSPHATELAIYLTSTTMTADLDAPVEIGVYNATSPSYPTASTYSFNIPASGNYHVALADIGSNSWGVFVRSFSIEQTEFDTADLDDIAIEGCETDTPQYFDLQGRRISKPAKGQMLIKVENQETTKILF